MKHAVVETFARQNHQVRTDLEDWFSVKASQLKLPKPHTSMGSTIQLRWRSNAGHKPVNIRGRSNGDPVRAPPFSGSVHILFPPSARCSGHLSAGRQGGSQSGRRSRRCRVLGRQRRLPSGLSPARRRRPHHRGKVAGTRVANAGMGFEGALVCAPSSPSGCDPDRHLRTLALAHCSLKTQTFRDPVTGAVPYWRSPLPTATIFISANLQSQQKRQAV